MFLVTSPIVINVPTRGLLAVETMHVIVQRLENLNIKRNMTSMFVNKKYRYTTTCKQITWVWSQRFARGANTLIWTTLTSTAFSGLLASRSGTVCQLKEKE